MESNQSDFSNSNSSAFDDDWEQIPVRQPKEAKMTHIDEAESFYTDSVTNSATDSASFVTSTEENDDESVSFEQELISTLKPYADMYKELNIIRKKLGDTSSYQFGLFLMNDICDKLDFIMKNSQEKSTYCRIVIDRLWNLSGKNGDVNIIQLIFSYLSICDRYSDKNFAQSTFDGCPRRVKKEKYDKNYDLYVNAHKGIDQFNQLISDKFTNFCLIFKAFRTIIGKFVKHATGSWDVRSFAPRSEWKFSTWSGKTYTSSKSDEFTAFMSEIIDIYCELEKLSPELDELHAVFSEAKLESQKQREISIKSMKNFRSKPQQRPWSRPQVSRPQASRPQASRTHVESIPSQVKQTFVSAPPTVSAWTKGNPLVGNIQIAHEQPMEAQVQVAPDMDGFIVVKSKQRRR